MSTNERNARIPTGQIEFIVARMHVSASDLMVETDMVKRMAGTELNDRERKLIIRYALACHHRNQRLYRDVMGGMI